MCFSEKLTEKAAGYQEDHGFVLVGYKCVMQLGKWLMPWHALQRGREVLLEGGHVEMSLHRMCERSSFGVAARLGFEITTKMLEQIFSVGFPLFTPRTMLTIEPGEHAFHVAASEEAVCQNPSANPFGLEMWCEPMAEEVTPSDIKDLTPKMINLDQAVRCRPKAPGVMVRVLVPENAVDKTNHVHAMMIIPPGEKETEYDVAQCEHYNKHMPPKRDTDPFEAEREERRRLAQDQASAPAAPSITSRSIAKLMKKWDKRDKTHKKVEAVRKYGKSKALKAEAEKAAKEGRTVNYIAVAGST